MRTIIIVSVALGSILLWMVFFKHTQSASDFRPVKANAPSDVSKDSEGR